LLIDKYKTGLQQQLFKIVGSLDLFGNPYNLVESIGSGVVDFIDKPLEGFARGPLEGMEGILKGTSSLLNKTTQGTFNSIHKVTNNIGDQFIKLSMDSNYIQQRS
jgi:vacuolar protein sorting-associated protein 13A/C